MWALGAIYCRVGQIHLSAFFFLATFFSYFLVHNLVLKTKLAALSFY